MQPIETFAIFDGNGKMTIENIPFLKNKKVKFILRLDDEEEQNFSKLSAHSPSSGYSDDD